MPLPSHGLVLFWQAAKMEESHICESSHTPHFNLQKLLVFFHLEEDGALPFPFPLR